MIDKKDWLWIGIPMHFIGAHDCNFRLATIIGDYVISTVGDWRPGYEGRQQIGADRCFETFAFKGWSICNRPGCECGMPIIDNATEIDSDGYNTSQDAQDGHMRMCAKYANKGAE